MSNKDLGITMLMDFYLNLLSDSQRACLEYYYNEDYSLAEIAEILDMSRPGVLSNIKKGERALRRYEDTLHLYENHTARGEVCDEILRICNGIMQEHPDTDIGAVIRCVEQLR